MRRFHVSIELILKRVTTSANITDEFLVMSSRVHSGHVRSQMISRFEGNIAEITCEWAAGVVMPLSQVIVEFSLSVESVTTISAAKQAVVHLRVRHGIFNFYLAFEASFFDAFNDMVVFDRHVFGR